MLNKINITSLKQVICKQLNTHEIYFIQEPEADCITIYCPEYKFLISYDENKKKYRCTALINRTFRIDKPIEAEHTKIIFSNLINQMNEIYYLIISFLAKS